VADLAEVGQVLYRLDGENTIVVQAHHTSRYLPPPTHTPTLLCQYPMDGVRIEKQS